MRREKSAGPLPGMLNSFLSERENFWPRHSRRIWLEMASVTVWVLDFGGGETGRDGDSGSGRVRMGCGKHTFECVA